MITCGVWWLLAFDSSRKFVVVILIVLVTLALLVMVFIGICCLRCWLVCYGLDDTVVGWVCLAV